jgi:hypothetical protein
MIKRNRNVETKSVQPVDTKTLGRVAGGASMDPLPSWYLPPKNRGY